jgi:hypothetical protein
MVRKRISLLLLGAVTFSAAMASTAYAQKRAHPRDYLARAAEEVDLAPVAEAPKPVDTRPDCFVSYTAVEANRGIRHWTGKCH